MKCDLSFPEKCEKCIHNDVCYSVRECLNYIPDFKCDCFEEKRPHGEWLNKNIEFGGICWATCSVCKKISDGEGRDNGFGHDYFYPNFCPNCGADMRKEGEEE